MKYLIFISLIAINAQAAAPWDVCLANEIDSGQGYCMTDDNADGIADEYAPLVGICQAGQFPIEIRYLDYNQSNGFCAESTEPIETFSSTEWYAFFIKTGIGLLMIWGFIRAVT